MTLESRTCGLVIAACLGLAANARADEAGDALARLRASDELVARGRLGPAYSGYLDLVRRYPTWWIAVLKSGILAQALGLSPDGARSAVDRAASVAPDEPFVAFVRALVSLDEASSRPDGVGWVHGGDGDLPPSDLAVRLAMARGKWAERRGDRDAAVREYRWIAGRCTRCVAAAWRLARLQRGAGEEVRRGDDPEDAGRGSLFPPRWRRAHFPY